MPNNLLDSKEESPEPVDDEPEATDVSFDEVYGSIRDSVSDDQVENLKSLFDNSGVSSEQVSDTADTVQAVSEDQRQQVREIANQDFISDDVTQQIEGAFGPSSIEEMEEKGANIPSSADETVKDIENNALTSEEFTSQVSGDDFMSSVDDYMTKLQDLQGRLVDAQSPTQAEQETQEELDNLSAGYRSKMETVRNREAPQFLIRGDKAQAKRQYSIQKQALNDELERMRNDRSTKVDEITQTMDNTQQNFKLMKDLQDLSTPSTRQFKTVDGTMYAIQEDPMTGEIASKAVMNVPENDDVSWQGY